ncbi:UDP-N-acetylmuramoyl-tripeptide--D-alanyl-D-alanine ligase [Plebeiibacterium sediminum]|uniref:UDP-N-acetylmuramoyl-tripeptide--D-alanyl-D-alanine ligase n=1 Tax=Plebeiibacterium sediminum TaxID=2992112 RepID=A0AAE3SFW4_9BACT|nr:UDP-N-acetylmuramoyl-tripeptide--D-alanyl-D-alanine ligase [Plebeiobacterium sediminum]MCW3787502.1 UDP-N-acetylmuramoyl-tripeptide--D-alanyl-D-alanine ligase [Plebeiobacterium sediminum]
MHISDIYSLFLNSTGVCTDTRSISKNSLFFALKGANFNGNTFARQAIEQGASYAIVDEIEGDKSDKIIVVDDVLKTLQKLAHYHRKQLNIPILGITGTNGKTTTKELIKAVLETTHKVFATQGNLNNHIGVPLTLLSMDENTEIGIVEMGANHPGEIEFLCNIADPDYGIITNVGKAHLEGFGSFDGVKRTKSELYRHIEAKRGGLFVNSDNLHLKEMLKTGATLYTYGRESFNKVVLCELFQSDFLAFACSINCSELEINTNLVGNYNVENVLAAITIGSFFKVTRGNIAKALANYKPTNNRSQLEITSKNKVLFDAYNANPSSMEVALRNFISMAGDKKVVILGEMKELGEDSVKEHKKLVNFLHHKQLKVILVGESYKELIDGTPFTYLANVDELSEFLTQKPLLKSFILVKGSRSNRLEKIKELL